MKTGGWMTDQELMVELGKINKYIENPHTNVDTDLLLRACCKLVRDYYIKIKELEEFIEIK